MLEHLALSGNKTLDPMQITKTKGKRCQITLKKNYKEDPKLLFALFYVHGCVFYWFSILKLVCCITNVCYSSQAYSGLLSQFLNFNTHFVK